MKWIRRLLQCRYCTATATTHIQVNSIDIKACRAHVDAALDEILRVQKERK